LNVASAVAYARQRAIASAWIEYLRKLPRVPPDVGGAIKAVIERAPQRATRRSTSDMESSSP